MPTSRPKLPTVVNSNGVSKSLERNPMPKLNLDTSQFTKPDGTLDHEALGRVLTRLQDNMVEGTAPARSHPLAKMCVLENVMLVAGKQYTLKHTLGEPFARYDCKRSYAPTGKGVTGIAIAKDSSGNPLGGQGYPNRVTVSISPPDMPNGVQATATATVASGAVTAITVTKAGFGYSRNPTASIQASSGGGAILTVTLGTVYSETFSVSEVPTSDWPKGVTADQYLVLYSNCTGVYDLGIYGS